MVTVEEPIIDPFMNSDFYSEINKDPFDFGLFESKTPVQDRITKKLDNIASLEADLLAPAVPFTIVPGHHGGVISSLSNLF